MIFALARSGRPALSAVTVAGYIGAAYWFTSSTSFANPAVTARVAPAVRPAHPQRSASGGPDVR